MGELLILASLAGALQNDAAQANSYDNPWEAAWVAHSRSLYRTTGKTAGFVLEIGDSITHSNPYSQWPRLGSGQTPEDAALLAWCRAASWGSGNADTSNKNGWYLAAADTSGSRGMTASSGIDASELLSGTGNGGAAMPAQTDPAAARALVADGASYPGNLQIATVAAAFEDAQFALLMIGTNDASAGRPAAAYAADFAALVDALEARNIVPILSTLPPHYNAESLVLAYNAAIASLAQTRGLPLIDFHAEILARRPGTSWNGTLLNLDDVHPTASGAGYSSSSDPYTPGGNPASHTTGDACLNAGYLLRSWLAVQKLKEVKLYVADGVDPPGGGGGGGSSGSGGGCGATGAEFLLLGLLPLLRRATLRGKT